VQRPKGAPYNAQEVKGQGAACPWTICPPPSTWI